MAEYHDTLEELNKNAPLVDKLSYLHDVLQKRYVFIDRIAAAIYDAKTDVVKTFLHSSGKDNPLPHYEAKLADSGSLRAIVDSGLPRVVNDLNIFRQGTKTHTKRIAAQGYASSYTLPMYMDGNFFGFLFFNSYTKEPFDKECLHYLDLFGHMISLIISNELSAMKNLLATVKTAKEMAHLRDGETGAHLDRMAHYTRLIALKIADKHKFTDEHIEKLFLFSPLHDIGKIGIPDNVLLKPDKLSADEYKLMQDHTRIGGDIVSHMLEYFQLGAIESTDMLGNIARYHHEALDGSGYPQGLQGDAIPIEARIVAVADIFDALTSKRPYKQAWSNQDAFSMLQRLADIKLDGDCVQALISSVDEIEEIQQRFHEDPFG